jgi:hypothetical protein
MRGRHTGGYLNENGCRHYDEATEKEWEPDLGTRMTPKEEYLARKAAQEAKYKRKFFERRFSWWRNPPDRFAFLVAFFTAALFAATMALYLATRDLVHDAKHATEIAQQNFASDQRPYIWLVNESPTDPPDRIIQYSDNRAAWQWRLTNYGKSPALGVHLSTFMKIKDGDFKRGHGAETYTAPPVPQNSVYVDTVFSEETFTQEQFDSLLKEDYSVTISGVVTYTDLYGGRYT